MKRLESEKVTRRVITYEGLTFAALIAVTWMNARFQFPSLIWDLEKKEFAWEEALFESALILLAAAFVITITRNLMRRMDQLEGILPICSSCKNIKDENGHWQQVEQYVHQHSKADFSHGLCPDCAREWSEEAGVVFDTQLALKT